MCTVVGVKCTVLCIVIGEMQSPSNWGELYSPKVVEVKCCSPRVVEVKCTVLE